MIRIVADHIISPLGFTAAENFASIVAGRSAIRQIADRELWPKPFFGAAFTPDQLAQIEEEERRRGLSKLEAITAKAVEAVGHEAGIDITSPETQIILATTKGNIDLLLSEFRAPRHSLLNQYILNLSSHLNPGRTPLLVSNACISGLLAVIIGGRMLASGKVKNVIVTGGDLLTRFTLSGFQSFMAVSNEPCKPYDKNRSGISLGEAVGALAMTHSEDSAFPRYLSGATANDANHISGPSRTGEGLFQAAQRTLGNRTEEPGMISAHGTATPYNDEMECQAFNRLRLEETPLHSLKGVYGHTLGAAGVIETIIGLRALQNQVVLASAGFEQHGLSKPLNVTRTTTDTTYSTFLKTSSGFGGCNGAALFGL